MKDFPKAQRLGWAQATFYEARFHTVRKNLQPQYQARWDGMSYVGKCRVVAGLIRKGALI